MNAKPTKPYALKHVEQLLMQEKEREKREKEMQDSEVKVQRNIKQEASSRV